MPEEIEQQINTIKDSIRQMVQLITQRGEPLTDELRQMIAQAMEHAATRIQQLRQQQAAQEQPNPQIPVASTPEITQSMPSSNVYGFNYDYDNGRLLVKFQGDRNAGEGPIYSYEGVPPYIFNLFKRGAAIAKTSGRNKWGSWYRGKTPSIGAAMDAFIKNGGYSYQRLQ